MDSIERAVLRWFLYGEVGSSSKALAGVLCGFAGDNDSHPYDPDDFRRCVELLNAVPGSRKLLHHAKDLGGAWPALVDNWRELEGLLIEELPNGKAPKLYNRMKELGC